MNRAIIIRTVGDPATANAIAQGMTAHIIPLTSAELETVKAERDALQAYKDVHSYGAHCRTAAACLSIPEDYPITTHGPLYWALLLPWAMICYAVQLLMDWVDRLAEWRP